MSNDQLGYHEKPVDNPGAREEYTDPVPAVLLTIKLNKRLVGDGDHRLVAMTLASAHECWRISQIPSLQNSTYIT
jgi:hypothetical protein